MRYYLYWEEWGSVRGWNFPPPSLEERKIERALDSQFSGLLFDHPLVAPRKGRGSGGSSIGGMKIDMGAILRG